MTSVRLTRNTPSPLRLLSPSCHAAGAAFLLHSPVKIPLIAETCRRGFANIRDQKDILFRDTSFTSNAPRLSIDPQFPGGRDHKPPDERTLKLGKSTSIASVYPINYISNHFISCSHPSRAPSNPPRQSTTTRDPLTEHSPPSLPLHTPSPSHCLGSSCISSSTMDLPYSLGSRTGCRQCKTHSPIRTHDAQRHQLARREACCKMEDMRQDQEQRHWRSISGHRCIRAGRQDHRVPWGCRKERPG